MSDDLTKKHCVPCEGEMLPMTPKAAEMMMGQIPGWTLREDGKEISRDFKFKDFKTAVLFVNQVAVLAEAEGHHPDILIYGWNKVRLTLSTHAIKGLSGNDFIMAAKISGTALA